MPTDPPPVSLSPPPNRLQLGSLNEWGPPLLLIAGGILALIYVNPWIFGLVFLVFGLIYSIFTVIKRRRHTGLVKYLIVPVLFIIIGLTTFILSDAIKLSLLDSFYGGKINPKKNLNQKTESIIGDKKVLWPIRLSQADRVIDIPNVGSKEVGDLLSSSEGRLFFLTGPAGTGKTPLLQQWAYALLHNHTFENVFIIYLTKEVESLNNNPTLPELVAHSNTYRDIIKDPDYYDMLFKARPCLIVLDELDEINPAHANNIMEQANILVKNTPSKVMIGSRPEGVILSDFYRRDLQFTPDVVIYNIDALGDKQRDYFIKDAINYFKSKEGTIGRVETLLNTKPAVKEMATQLDYLNEIVKSIDEFENKSEFEIIAALVEKRKRRSEGTHGERVKHLFAETMKEVNLIAYGMSSGDEFQTMNNDLQLSGFVTVASDKLEFSPRVLQSYFTVKALQLESANPATFSKTILSDIARFQPVDERLAARVKEAFRKDPLTYHKSLDSVRQIIHDDDFLLKALKSSSSDDLVKKVILAK